MRFALVCLLALPAFAGDAVVNGFKMHYEERGQGEAGQAPLLLWGTAVWTQSVPGSSQFYLGIVFRDVTDETHARLSRYIDRIQPSHLPASV